MTRHSTRTRGRSLAAALVTPVILGLAVWLVAAHQKSSVHASGAPVPGSAGMRVGIDPETGQLGLPTPEQAAALEKATGRTLDWSAQGLHVVHHPDGSRSVDLQGRFMSYSVAHRDAHGKIVTECLDGESAATDALRRGQPVPARAGSEVR